MAKGGLMAAPGMIRRREEPAVAFENGRSGPLERFFSRPWRKAAAAAPFGFSRTALFADVNLVLHLVEDIQHPVELGVGVGGHVTGPRQENSGVTAGGRATLA